MIITKHYEIGITGKFQSRRFGTTLTVDADKISWDQAAPVAEDLQKLCIKLVENDIKAMRRADPNFSIIEAAAQEELDKFVKYQEGVKKSEDKRRPL
jgi:hypothetical protein